MALQQFKLRALKAFRVSSEKRDLGEIQSHGVGFDASHITRCEEISGSSFELGGKEFLYANQDPDETHSILQITKVVPKANSQHQNDFEVVNYYAVFNIAVTKLVDRMNNASGSAFGDESLTQEAFNKIATPKPVEVKPKSTAAARKVSIK